MSLFDKIFGLGQSKVTRVIRTYRCDGTLLNETIETNQDPTQASAEADRLGKNLESFFQKMDEAFKELF